MTQEQHFDVAAYALGVLDERDASRFEDHLIDCPACAVELESFIQVADILADVDADALVAAEESRKDGLVLKQMIGEVKKERRQANSRRLYSLAAAVVVFAMLSIGALFAGGQWFGTDQKQAPPTAQRSSGPEQLDPLPITDGGIGGPDSAPTAQHHCARACTRFRRDIDARGDNTVRCGTAVATSKRKIGVTCRGNGRTCRCRGGKHQRAAAPAADQ